MVYVGAGWCFLALPMVANAQDATAGQLFVNGQDARDGLGTRTKTGSAGSARSSCAARVKPRDDRYDRRDDRRDNRRYEAVIIDAMGIVMATGS